MINITLICAGGFSTSMLVVRMQEAAKIMGMDVNIRASAECEFRECTGEAPKTDVLLLGPQVRYMLDKFKKLYEAKGVKVGIIDNMDYGMMDGEKVLKKALSL